MGLEENIRKLENRIKHQVTELFDDFIDQAIHPPAHQVNQSGSRKKEILDANTVEDPKETASRGESALDESSSCHRRGYYQGRNDTALELLKVLFY